MITSVCEPENARSYSIMPSKRKGWLIVVIMVLFQSLFVFSDDTICDRLSTINKKHCLDFIQKNPGEYEEASLSESNLIYIANQNNKIYFIEKDTLLQYPMTVVNSSNILVLGIENTDGKLPELAVVTQSKFPPASIRRKGTQETIKYRLTHPSYYRKEIIGSIDQCRNCLVSGFIINTDVDNGGNVGNIFTVVGDKSKIQFDRITVNKKSNGSYFDVKNVDAIKITGFYANTIKNAMLYRDPVINIENSNEVFLDDISIPMIEPYKFSRKEGVIKITNPIKFDLLNTTITFVSDYGYYYLNSGIIAINILFNKPAQYKNIVVKGRIEKANIKGLDDLTSDGIGVKLDGSPSDWVSWLYQAYRQVKGIVNISDSQLPDSDHKIKKTNLPNLAVNLVNTFSSSSPAFTVPLMLSTMAVKPASIHSIASFSSAVKANNSGSIEPSAIFTTRHMNNNTLATIMPVSPTPALDNSKECNRLSGRDKAKCLDFFKQNVGKYTIEKFSGKESIHIKDQRNKIVFIESSMELTEPITIIDSDNIAVFGIKNTEGKYPELKLADESKEQKGLGYRNIGNLSQCRHCLISGFNIKTHWRSEDTIGNIKNIFSASGHRSIIMFDNINVDKKYLSGYFYIDGVESVSIKNFHVNYRKYHSNSLASPAIYIADTDDITIRNVSIINFDPELDRKPEGIIRINNPVRFSISNTHIEASEDSGAGRLFEGMTGISVQFDDFNKYKNLNVRGVIKKVSISHKKQRWPDFWYGVRFNGKPETLSDLWGRQYTLVKGTVEIIDNSLPDAGGKARKQFLPNLNIDDGTAAPLVSPSFEVPARFPTTTVTTPAIRTTPVLSTFVEAIPPALITSVLNSISISRTPAGTGISTTSHRVNTSDIKTESAGTPALIGKITSTTPSSRTRKSDNSGSDRLSDGAVGGISAAIVGVVIIGIAILGYCLRSKHTTDQTSGEMVPMNNIPH